MTKFRGWDMVVRSLNALADVQGQEPVITAAARGWTLDEGQCRSIRAIAGRIASHGVLLADEVGMGKTRIAVAVARAVVEAGGRVAVLVPPALGFQWQEELLNGGLATSPTLRSLRQFLDCWNDQGLTAEPWFLQPVVLVSHAFTNWRLGATAARWRWALLPELYAQWRKKRTGRLPRNYSDDERLLDLLGERDQQLGGVAKAIADLAASPGHAAMAAQLDQLIEQTPWKASLDAAEYVRHEGLRDRLECAVGLGLGQFDLVIVDEAHKSRGEISGLTHLLEGVVQCTSGSAGPRGGRRLSMTATPIELGIEQWSQALQRIGVTADHALQNSIAAYAKAVSEVRQQPSQPSARAGFAAASNQFHGALAPYLLRRDKRESPWVKKFCAGTGLPMHAYREESQISIETSCLPPNWRQAICTAEALSLLAGQQEDGKAQRLRLTIGNGHGINSLLDRWTCDEIEDARQLEHEADAAKSLPDGALPPTPEASARDKSVQRKQWWMGQLAAAFADGQGSLYEHPSLLAAVKVIEDANAEQEKVLVFGRFTRPMRALVDILNARAMLYSLDADRPWPQATIADEEWEAVQAAHRQINRPGILNRQSLNAQLEAQYRALENARERSRSQLPDRLRTGLAGMPHAVRAQGLFEAFSRSGRGLAALAKALGEMLGEQAPELPPLAWAQAFTELVEASSDRDEGENDGDGKLDATEAGKLWATLAQRLEDEYTRPQGGFSRLMHGDTPPPTRRLLQLAFNRQASFPRVLVAQSLVGREGLNLHRACRTVVLLHPEWNPGVVEQQIGRIDRIGSRWEQLLSQAIEQGVDSQHWPRIRIMPVVFKGTYDEANWQVLRHRWDELRAQLHGVVIPESSRSGDPLADGWIDEINAAAPSFSPQ